MDAESEPLDALNAPLCEACGTLERMRATGAMDRPRWICPACGAVRLA